MAEENTENTGSTDEIVAVIDNPEDSRYEVHVDGKPAGVAEYRRSEGTIEFTHTEVDEAYSGKGLAQQLAEQALDEAGEAGLAVVPSCKFIAKHIGKNPKYVDLVPEDRRAEFGLS